ncbi:hypothetical protein [Roseateles sp.]|uniref:hypothetical protein n=1 Tax=Roseateles sp. TaxID=1971397 RepID=UPI0031D724C6
MNQVVVTAMQWSEVPDITDINPQLDAADAACLAGLREVLLAHGKLDRFGVNLLHKHFELSDDEFLIETIDVERRVLTVKPVTRAALPQAVPTQWNLSSRDPLQWCEAYCNYSGGTHHHGHQNHIDRDQAPPH